MRHGPIHKNVVDGIKSLSDTRMSAALMYDTGLNGKMEFSLLKLLFHVLHLIFQVLSATGQQTYRSTAYANICIMILQSQAFNCRC